MEDKPNRQSIRVQGYDYSKNGGYYITICSQNRENRFGEIVNREMKLNNAGKMIKRQWEELEKKYEGIELEEFTVMPNHFHGIILLNHVGVPLVGTLKNNTTLEPTRATTRVAPTNETIGDIIGAFKSITTNKYIQGVKQSKYLPFNKRLWQRNYYEHVIRSENSLYKIREYIYKNPANWEQDVENTAVTSTKEQRYEYYQKTWNTKIQS